MARSFTTLPLPAAHVDLAYPLVSAALPGVDLLRWREYADIAGGEAEHSRGIIGLRGDGDYLCGVMAFHVGEDLRHGRVLSVDLFIALDLVNEGHAIRTLLDVAETKAREMRCAAVQISINSDHKGLSDTIENAGYVSEARLLHKPVTGRVATN